MGCLQTAAGCSFLKKSFGCERINEGVITKLRAFLRDFWREDAKRLGVGDDSLVSGLEVFFFSCKAVGIFEASDIVQCQPYFFYA